MQQECVYRVAMDNIDMIKQPNGCHLESILNKDRYQLLSCNLLLFSKNRMENVKTDAHVYFDEAYSLTVYLSNRIFVITSN